MLMLLVSLAVGSVIAWVTLIIAMLVVQRIANLAFPPLAEFLWKSAAIILAAGVVDFALGFVHGWFGTLGSLIVFVILMLKVFDLEFWQLAVIAVATWFIRAVLLILIIGAFAR
jgi:hypothetical protein